MCSFDLENPCPVYSITHPRCRKPAPCRVCYVREGKRGFESVGYYL